MAKKRHRKGLFPALCAVGILLAALAAGVWFRAAAFPRLEAAGFRISEEEYLRVLYQARNDVLSDHAAAGISLTDWSAETALGDPASLVTERALELLQEYYAVATLAVERGYLADAGYEAMLRDMERINAERQAALDAGEIVTGLPQFTVNDYLTYRTSSLKLQFCSDPNNPEYQVRAEEIQTRYEADRDNLYRQPDGLELAFLLADGADEALAADFQRALQIGDLSLALEELPHLAAYYQEISVDSGTYSVYSRSHGDVLSWAADLQTGGIGLFRRDDRLCLIHCLNKTVRQYMPLEDVQSIVVQSIRESRYDGLIAERTERTQVSGDLDALYRFTAEQLP